MEYRQRRPGSQPSSRKGRIFVRRDADVAEYEGEPASRHYAGHAAGIPPEDTPHVTTADVRSRLPTTRRPHAPDDYVAGSFVGVVNKRYDVAIPVQDGVIYRKGNEQIYVHNGPPPMPQRASKGKNTTAQYQLPQHGASLQAGKLKRRQLHWLFWIGIAFLIAVLGYVVLNAIGSWWQIHNDDTTYGRPRTFQTDAVVGHGDSAAHPSHFIAVNLNRHVVIVEIPGGDISNALIYGAGTLLGDSQDLTPATLTFSDVNGDGKPDMIVHILDQTIVFLNNGAKFVPPSNLTSGESNLPAHGE